MLKINVTRKNEKFVSIINRKQISHIKIKEKFGYEEIKITFSKETTMVFKVKKPYSVLLINSLHDDKTSETTIKTL